MCCECSGTLNSLQITYAKSCSFVLLLVYLEQQRLHRMKCPIIESQLSIPPGASSCLHDTSYQLYPTA